MYLFHKKEVVPGLNAISNQNNKKPWPAPLAYSCLLKNDVVDDIKPT